MSKRKIILLHQGKSDGSHGYFADGLEQAGLDEYDVVRYGDLVVSLDGREVQVFTMSGSELRPFQADLVYIRGIGQTDLRQFIAHYCADKNITFMNTENKLTSPASKLNQYYAFSKHDVPYPRTTVAFPRLLSRVAQMPGTTWPVIVKSINGKRGESNYLVKDAQQLDDLIADLDNNQAYAIQPYIENDGDYRVIAFNGEVIGCYKRSRQQGSAEHRNNVHQGGTREALDPVPEMISSIAHKVATSLNRELTGTDILVDGHGQPYVLESNYNFGLRSGDDGIAERIVQRLAEKFHEAAS